MRLQRRIVYRQDFSDIFTDDEGDADFSTDSEQEQKSCGGSFSSVSSLLVISMTLYSLAMYANLATTMHQYTTVTMGHFRSLEGYEKLHGKMLVPTNEHNYISTNVLAGDARKKLSLRQTPLASKNTNIPAVSKQNTKTMSKIMTIKTAVTPFTEAKRSPSIKIIPSKEQTRKKYSPNVVTPSFKDSWDPLDKTVDIPVFWHIPKAGGTAIKNIMGSCHDMVIASEVGIKGHTKDVELKVVKVGEKGHYVNVDTSTKEGMIRAKKMKLVESNLADIIITPLLHEVNSLFSDTDVKSGRVFTLFRHPIERAVSMFNYLQYAEWEPTYDAQLRNMTLEVYSESKFVENNFITRKLSNNLKESLDETHLKTALNVLRTKILVGLMSDMDSSLDKFEKFFEWRFESYDQEKCREVHVSSGGNRNTKEKTVVPQKSTLAYKMLESQNIYDIRIYNYAVKLFKEQDEFVINKPNKFRLSDGV